MGGEYYQVGELFYPAEVINAAVDAQLGAVMSRVVEAGAPKKVMRILGAMKQDSFSFGLWTRALKQIPADHQGLKRSELPRGSKIFLSKRAFTLDKPGKKC